MVSRPLSRQVSLASSASFRSVHHLTRRSLALLVCGAVVFGAVSCSSGREVEDSEEHVRITFQLLDVAAFESDPARRQTVEVVARVAGNLLEHVETRTASAGAHLASSITVLSRDGDVRLLNFGDCQSESYPVPPGGSTLSGLISDTIGSWGNPEGYGFKFDGQDWARADQDLIYRQRDQSSDLEMLSVDSKRVVSVISNRTLEIGEALPDFAIALPERCQDELPK